MRQNVSVIVGITNRIQVTSTTFKVFAAGSTATWIGGLAGFTLMTLSVHVGSYMMLLSPLLGGLTSGLLLKDTERAVGIGALAAMLGITLFTVGVALAPESPLGLLLILPLGMAFACAVGGVGGYAGHKLRLLITNRSR